MASLFRLNPNPRDPSNPNNFKFQLEERARTLPNSFYSLPPNNFNVVCIKTFGGRRTRYPKKNRLPDHVDIPVRYASLESVYSVSSSSSSLCCISAAGSHKKVNAQKHSMTDALQGYGRADGFELRPHRRPEIVHVYCRRKRRRRRRRRESFVELAIAQNEGVERKDRIVKTESTELEEEEEEEKKKKPKRRRIGNGELMKLGMDSTTLSISDTPGLRGCRIKAVCSRSKQNGYSRRKKIDENVGLGGSFDSIGESGWIDDVTYMMLMSFLNFR